MKTFFSVILFLTISFSSFSQLSKASIAQNFPLLNLPFKFELKEIPFPADDGSVDWKKYPIIKSDINGLLVNTPLANIERTGKNTLNQILDDTKNSDIRAIGYVNYKDFTFIIFNLYRKVPGVFIDNIYIASLNKEYQIVDVSKMGTHFIAPDHPKGFVQEVLLYNLYINQNGLLEMRETLKKSYLKNKMGEETTNFDFKKKGYVFGENGTVLYTSY